MARFFKPCPKCGNPCSPRARRCHDCRFGTKKYIFAPVGVVTVRWMFEEIISKCQGQIS